MSKPFVFSCDAHVAEPPELFLEGMPAHLRNYAIHGEADGKYRLTKIGDTIAIKSNSELFAHKISEETRRLGARDLDKRLKDMDRDGVDAELVFPSLGLVLPRIDDVEAQAAACQVYNDWVWDFTRPVKERLIPAAMIPCIDFDAALAECQRVAAKGFAALCLWEGMGNYNDPRWDPIFAFAGDNDLPIVFHTGVGLTSIRAKKNPGGALFNYTRQMNDAVEIITELVAGGVLDRNPKAHILFAEHGAGWLLGLAERLDEVYQGHAPAVEPKLSRQPSQIVRDQVHCALQNDIGSLMTRRLVGIDALLFATDYPHGEGTFPFSQDIIQQMRVVNPDLTNEEFVAVLGGNAAKLFKRANLNGAVEKAALELA